MPKLGRGVAVFPFPPPSLKITPSRRLDSRPNIPTTLLNSGTEKT